MELTWQQCKTLEHLNDFYKVPAEELAPLITLGLVVLNGSKLTRLGVETLTEAVANGFCLDFAGIHTPNNKAWLGLRQ